MKAPIQPLPPAVVIFIALLSVSLLSFVYGGCRDQERVECETVCHWNASSGQHNCNLRAVLILPSNLSYEASLIKVLPVFELAEQKIRRDEILPRHVHLNWTTYDDNCESSLATISAVNGFTFDCAHVQFGPICDYSLAPVSRIVKYFRHDGTPLITVGGYTYDFIQNKTTCANEYHMLIRAGLLSFQSIADFMVAIMNKYDWKHALLYYERDGQYNVAGEHTCHLLMQTIAKLFRNLNLSFSSFSTDQAGGNNVTETLRKKVGAHESNAFFGPTCDYVLAPVSRYCGVWEIPVITAGGFAEAFNFKSMYPTLTRMLGSYKHVGHAAHSIIKEFNWNTVMLLYHNHDEASGKGNSDCYFTLGGIYRFLTNSSQENFDEEKTTRVEFLQLLEKVKKKARIVIMCANPNTIREIMLAAEELNMVDSGDYVFFNIELFSSMTATSVKPWYNPDDNDTTNERAKTAYTALLTVIAKQPEDDEYLEFSKRVKELAEQKYNYTFTEPVSTFVTAFYDAVLLYAYALNQSIQEDPQTLYRPMNGTKITHLMWNRNFKGITGNVTIDSNGDRISDYSLLDMNPETGYFEIVANYFNKTGLQYVEGKSIHWAGGRSEPPPDRPICGFDNSLCPDNSLPGYAILSLVLGFAIILMAIASLLGYRHYRLEAEINSMTWKINWNDVLPCNPASKHRGSLHSLAKRGSQLTVGSEDLGSIAGDKQLFIPIGFYKGCKVAIKRINESNITLNREQMLELKRMKDIQHEHLVRFYGACVDPPNCSILTEYCPKGSLQDILENDQIKLDWMFKLSLMHDITRGMHFLHTTDIKSHGNLKSSNCVVDSRFVLKITDFGLHKMRSSSADDESENADSFAYWRKMLWTAPELLRLDNRAHEGTPKGDVYSFGIIVHEITTRQGPFYLGTDDKSPKEIIQLVMDGAKHNGNLFRPKIDETAFDDVNSIMVKCWNEDPGDRPDLTILKSTIRKINKENETGNIVDNLQRMEQYANNLEGLVEERTQDYLEEKKKCEELLYQLLPKSVAAQLIFGKPVIAEVFEQVTIYFSDIVGFTSISAASTPMQVVDLLNDLYTCFDSIVENFDVYKVETIGDAYMVVSGLPVRNGHLHAREIARTALALLKNVHKFKIRHRPDEQLRLRIGLHSGSCVAGVVGLKMPRYCLFGDTVNTASRMESNGEALKIHISHSTKTILDSFGTFDTTERGLVDMKGKGKMLTYWLNGEHTNDDIMNHNEQQSTISEASTVAEMAVQSMHKNGSIHNNHKMPNNDKNPTLIHFNNLVKSNNLKNTQYKKMCNLDEDSLRNNVNQPLLTKIS